MKRRAVWLSLMVFAALCGGCALWVQRERQQDTRNRQLIVALEKDDTTTALALVNEGADPNTRQSPSPAPTLRSLLSRLLHRSPVPINASPTAFLMACGEHFELGHHSKGEPPSMHAIHEDGLLVQAMITHGAKVQQPEMHRLYIGEGNTALHAASWARRLRTLELLLRHGANPNGHSGATPLGIAAVGDWEDGVRLLLAQGANPNTAGFPSDSYFGDFLKAPLPIAVGRAAASKDDNAVVHILLEGRADPNKQDCNGYTALYVAVMYNGSFHLVSDLLSHGADPNIPNKAGYTPLQMARDGKRTDVVRLLKQYGAK